MASDPASGTRAAVLAATLTFEPEPLDPFALRVTPVRRFVAGSRGPLNLDAAIYRYRIDAENRVTVIDEPAGARLCSHRERDHRRH